jgi:hypothetical protein
VSFEVLGPDISLPASGDLSANQYLFVKLNSSGQVVLAGAGDLVIGVQQNKPAAAGRAATVRTAHVTKCIAGATIAAGAAVECDANGKAKTAVQGTVSGANVVGGNVAGIALKAAVSGDVFPLLVIRGGVMPTTQS